MADIFYTKNYFLRHADFDMLGNIKINRIMEFAEDAAQEHTELLGIGMPQLNKENAAWVLLREKIELLGEFVKHSQIQVKTWHCGKAKHISTREFLISCGKNAVAKISSQWAVINIEKRTMVLPKAFENFTDFSDETVFENKISGIKMPECLQRIFSYTASYLDIDMNKHINNTHYAELVQNALGALKIKDIQIDFHKEILLGNTVDVLSSISNSVAYVKGMCNSDTMFCAKAELI